METKDDEKLRCGQNRRKLEPNQNNTHVVANLALDGTIEVADLIVSALMALIVAT